MRNDITVEALMAGGGVREDARARAEGSEGAEMIPRIGFLSVKPETFMERYGYDYANTLQTWSSDSTNPAPAPTIRIGRHDYLQAKVARCDHCAHTSPLRDLRGGCVACGAPIVNSGETVEVTSFGDTVRQFLDAGDIVYSDA